MSLVDREVTSTVEIEDKIISINTLLSKLSCKRSGQTIVQCHGVFDLLHIGHIRHFQYAKSLGDILIVTITADTFVNKGPGRPYFPEQLRAEALASLSCIDYIVIDKHITAVDAIKAIRPNLYVKGVEYRQAENDITGKITKEEEAVQLVGGQLRFTEDIVFSSSSLLNQFFSPYSAEIVFYLEQLKQKYKINDILNILNGAQQLKVLVIGESIIDIYHFGEAIGKAGKEPVLVTKYHREETYIGGVLAVANHLSGFCSKITCLTALGEKGEYESLIRQKLNTNVDVHFQYKKDSPTIVKRRYLEEYTSQKLFEIYEINDSYLENDQKIKFINEIDELIDKHDLVVVTDYGHGLLDDDVINQIESKSKFLAINTQSNASNHGFNCVSKYRKADYVCIATRELQLNYRQKHISIIEQVNQLTTDYGYQNVLITAGRQGAYSYKEEEGIYQIPAFATSIIDRVGAGDAVLAITSLCVAQNAPAELVGFIGNVVGGEAINIMGNRTFIEKIPLMKHIMHMLK
ncbi:MAG TPA: PfkB family carbohydrate kinase [Gammaproteobacteria bacterium]|nr:PfkB family carbohydrate kinase [Gammaproteobacteria bacterium]